MIQVPPYREAHKSCCRARPGPRATRCTRSADHGFRPRGGARRTCDVRRRASTLAVHMAKERSAELLYVAHDAECSTSEGPAGVGPSASVAGPSSRSRPRASVPRRAVPRAASLPRPRSRLLRAAALLLRTARAWRRRRAPLAPARRSDRAVLRGRRGRLRRRGAQLHRLLEPVDDLRLKLAARRDGGEMSPPSRARRPHPDLVVGDARKERAVRVQVRLQPLSRQRAPARVYLQDARDLDALVGVAVRGDDGVAHHAYGRAASRAISELARPPLQSRAVHRTLADRAEELVGGEHSAEAERLAPRGAAQQGGGVAQQGGGGGRREAAVVRRGRQRVCGSRWQGVSHRSRRFSAFSSASSRSRPRRYGSGAAVPLLRHGRGQAQTATRRLSRRRPAPARGRCSCG